MAVEILKIQVSKYSPKKWFVSHSLWWPEGWNKSSGLAHAERGALSISGDQSGDIFFLHVAVLVVSTWEENVAESEFWMWLLFWATCLLLLLLLAYCTATNTENQGVLHSAKVTSMGSECRKRFGPGWGVRRCLAGCKPRIRMVFGRI